MDLLFYYGLISLFLTLFCILAISVIISGKIEDTEFERERNSNYRILSYHSQLRSLFEWYDVPIKLLKPYNRKKKRHLQTAKSKKFKRFIGESNKSQRNTL